MNLRASESVTGHVYLVEDNASIRLSLTDILHAAGHRVTCFESGSHFADHLGMLYTGVQREPAVVLIDMTMPGLTGLEVQTLVKQRGIDMPFVFISGESTLQQALGAMRQGAIEFLTKPFDIDDLLAAVDKAMRTDQLQRAAREQARRREAALAQLTPRERAVCERMARGLNNTELAEEFGLSIPTIKQYKHQVLSKLALGSLAELMVLFQGNDAGPTQG